MQVRAGGGGVGHLQLTILHTYFLQTATANYPHLEEDADGGYDVQARAGGGDVADVQSGGVGFAQLKSACVVCVVCMCARACVLDVQAHALPAWMVGWLAPDIV